MFFRVRNFLRRTDLMRIQEQHLCKKKKKKRYSIEKNRRISKSVS